MQNIIVRVISSLKLLLKMPPPSLAEFCASVQALRINGPKRLKLLLEMAPPKSLELLEKEQAVRLVSAKRL